MPLYHLHRRFDGILVEDPDGSELADLDAARAEALIAARHLWAAAILREHDLSDNSFEITDSDGACLLIVPFADALPARLRRRPG